MTLLATAGGTRVSLSDLEEITPPVYTRTHRPITFVDAVGTLRQEVSREIGYQPSKEGYVLSRNQQRMFAVLAFPSPMGDSSESLSIGLRQSYDKSLALGVVAGSQITVCDNLCFSGNSFKAVRKNTTNVDQAFRRLLWDWTSSIHDEYKAAYIDRLAMSGTHISDTRGHALLGAARGKGIIAPKVATIAHADWTEPRHPEFKPRTLWSLYQCVTEGLKSVSVTRRISEQSKAHEFFKAASSSTLLALT